LLLLRQLLLLLLLLLLLSCVLGESSLGRIIYVIVTKAVNVVQVAASELLGRSSSCRGCRAKRSGSGRLGRSPQTCEQVRTASSRSWQSVLLIDARLDVFERERLDVLAASARSEPSRVAEPVGGNEVVGRHLSKTASVHSSGR
jgi:hypothetical protein